MSESPTPAGVGPALEAFDDVVAEAREHLAWALQSLPEPTPDAPDTGPPAALWLALEAVGADLGVAPIRVLQALSPPAAEPSGEPTP